MQGRCCGARAHPAFVGRVGHVGEVELAHSQCAGKSPLQQPDDDGEQVRLGEAKRDEEACGDEDADEQHWPSAKPLAERAVKRGARKLAKEVSRSQQSGEERHIRVIRRKLELVSHQEWYEGKDQKLCGTRTVV